MHDFLFLQLLLVCLPHHLFNDQKFTRTYISATVQHSHPACTVNDQYTAVRQLYLNREERSATDHNSVQKSCVDEKLTGQCIQYHNDQWFSYVPESDLPFFINVWGQSCRNGKGVQLVAFTGELCHPDSYQILTCISTANPLDFYYKIEKAEPGRTYYFIIDGYLGDFCNFSIEAAGTARGLPSEPNEPVATAVVSADKEFFRMDWRYDVANAGNNKYWYVRRLGPAKVKTWTMPLAQNSFGKLLQDYNLADTLTVEGGYTYEVYLVNELEEHRLFVREKTVWRKPAEHPATVVYFPFEVPKTTNLQIAIFEPFTGRLLESRFVRDYKRPGFEYDFAGLIQQGKYFFEVQVQDMKTKRKEVFEKAFLFEN